MLATSFRLEVVKKEAPKDVKRLSSIGEAARVIAVEVWGVVFLFEHGLPQENKGPGDVEAVWRLPFAPHAEEGVPGLSNRDAFHEAMLGKLWKSMIITFASSRDSHDLKPGANRQSIVEDQPSERPHFVGAGIMPHSGDDMGNRRVSKVQLLNEGDNVESVLFSPGIPGDDSVVRAGSLNSSSVGRFFELLGACGDVGYVDNLINPFWRGDLADFLFVDPVPYRWLASDIGRVPWDVGYDEVPV
ncbi:unnamed protein product [Sphagnum balticum]